MTASAPAPTPPPLSRSQRFWLNTCLVLSWAALIWMLGGGDFSARDTSRIIGPLLEWLFPNMEHADKRFWLYFVRKLAHVTEYGVFAVLVLRLALLVAGRRLELAKRTLETRRLVMYMALALTATAVLALLDEGRQGRLGNRTGSLYDVGLDLAGGLLGLVCAISLASLVGRPLLGVPGWPGSAAARPSATRQP